MAEDNDNQAMLPFDDGSVGRVVRREYYDGQWYFSVIDVVAVLTDAKIPRNYWSESVL